MTEADGEYGIVANVLETDRLFRTGARVWIAGGTGGEGWYRFRWLGATRSGRIVEKWAPTYRFHSFRAAWVPKHLRDRVASWWMRGEREAMTELAAKLESFAAEERRAHPNRQRKKEEDMEPGNDARHGAGGGCATHGVYEGTGCPACRAAELPDVFTNRPPTVRQAHVLDQITAGMLAVYNVLGNVLPPSAERTLAIRKLEEASMWAKKAAVFDGDVVPGPVDRSTRPQPDGGRIGA